MQAWFHELHHAQAAAVEQACEAAIQGGACGVSVYRWTDRYTAKLEAVVDPTVPYGHIHEHNSPPPDPTTTGDT